MRQAQFGSESSTGIHAGLSFAQDEQHTVFYNQLIVANHSQDHDVSYVSIKRVISRYNMIEHVMIVLSYSISSFP